MNGLKRKTLTSILVLLILLIGNLQAAWRSEQLQLSGDQLSKLQGGQSFWKDLCNGGWPTDRGHAIAASVVGVVRHDALLG